MKDGFVPRIGLIQLRNKSKASLPIRTATKNILPSGDKKRKVCNNHAYFECTTEDAIEK